MIDSNFADKVWIFVSPTNSLSITNFSPKFLWSKGGGEETNVRKIASQGKKLRRNLLSHAIMVDDHVELYAVMRIFVVEPHLEIWHLVFTPAKIE